MTKKVFNKSLIVYAALAVLAAIGLVVPRPASAATTACEANPSSEICKDLNQTNDTGVNNFIDSLTNTILMMAGIIAVGMIVFAGIKYITSHGNSEQITKAKNTLIYAVTGLAITIVAYAIVKFVVDKL